MRIHGAFVPVAVAIVLLCTAATARAGTLGFSESEPNDSLEAANEVDFDATAVGGILTLSGFRGAGDSDWFRLTNLEPDVEYRVENLAIVIGIGLFTAEGDEIDSVAFTSPQVLFATADDMGELVVAVCGRLDNQSVLDCSAEGQGISEYEVTVPEPRAGLLAAFALLAVLALGARRRR